MRGLLFGLCLGAIAGILYAPATGSRTRSLIRDKYSSLNNEACTMLEDAKTLVQEKSGPIKEKMLTMREDVNNKLTEVRGIVDEKVGEIKEQVNTLKEQAVEKADQIRESA